MLIGCLHVLSGLNMCPSVCSRNFFNVCRITGQGDRFLRILESEKWNFGNFRANLGEKLFSGCTTMVDFGFHKHRGFIHQFILIFKSIEKELSKCQGYLMRCEHIIHTCTYKHVSKP